MAELPGTEVNHGHIHAMSSHGHIHAMSSLPPSSSIVYRQKFVSRSDPTKPPYETLVYFSGGVFSTSCNCPGWTRINKNGVRECKHTQMLQDRIDKGEISTTGATAAVPAAAGWGKMQDPTKPVVRRIKFD